MKSLHTIVEEAYAETEERMKLDSNQKDRRFQSLFSTILCMRLEDNKMDGEYVPVGETVQTGTA